MIDGIGLARATNFPQSTLVVCKFRRSRDIRIVVIFAMCCFFCCDARGSGSTRVESRDRPGSNGTFVRCLPIAHDVLWKRLRLVGSDFDRFRVESTPPTPVPLTNSEFTVLTTNESGKGTSFSASQNRLTGESGGRNPQNSRTDDDGNFASRRRRRNPERRPRRRPLHRRRRRGRRKPVDPSVLQRTSWHCRMSKYWKRMPAGLFPAYVQTGRCRQRVCVFGLFECRARRYRIKLLRRNDGVCNPLPNLGPSTAYEETWSFVEYKVVVGCECSRKRSHSSSSSSGGGRFSSSRGRNYTNDRPR